LRLDQGFELAAHAQHGPGQFARGLGLLQLGDGGRHLAALLLDLLHGLFFGLAGLRPAQLGTELGDGGRPGLHALVQHALRHRVGVHHRRQCGIVGDADLGLPAQHQLVALGQGLLGLQGLTVDPGHGGQGQAAHGHAAQDQRTHEGRQGMTELAARRGGGGVVHEVRAERDLSKDEVAAKSPGLCILVSECNENAQNATRPASSSLMKIKKATTLPPPT